MGNVLANNTHGTTSDLAKSIFASVIGTVPVYSTAITHVVDYFLREDQAAALEQLTKLARDGNPADDEEMFFMALTALSESLGPIHMFLF